MSKNPVLVLHGLGMNRLFMLGLTQHLRSADRNVYSISYPSRSKSFEDIVEEHIAPAIDKALAEKKTAKLDFVGHSMGGLLVRLYAKKHGHERIGRVVMLATPNHGSQVADFMKRWDVFRQFTGTVGPDLGTQAGDLHMKLPAKVPFDCGVIAGENKLLHFPATYLAGLPQPNDGIVSVESTKIEGMKAHTVIAADHSQIVWSPKAWKLTSQFLDTGAF